MLGLVISFNTPKVKTYPKINPIFHWWLIKSPLNLITSPHCQLTPIKKIVIWAKLRSRKYSISTYNLYARNIYNYRNLFRENDSSQLPFMSMLRNSSKQNKKKNYKTIIEPFSVSEKPTINVLTKKKTSDLNGKNSRLSDVYYRWHNKSGMKNRQSTNF